MISKSGHGAWKRMLLWGRQEVVTWLIAGLSKEMLILSILVKVVDSAEDKKASSQETLLAVHPLLVVGILIREAIEVPSTQP